MTIHGDCTGLSDIEVPAWLSSNQSQIQFAQGLAAGLLAELGAEAVDFDTSEGVVRFTHPNPAHEDLTGTTVAERSLGDWVARRMFEKDLPGLYEDCAPLVVNGINNSIRALAQD